MAGWQVSSSARNKIWTTEQRERFRRLFIQKKAGSCEAGIPPQPLAFVFSPVLSSPVEFFLLNFFLLNFLLF
ncbi:hypothetical protein [Holdemania sp. 1001302B_160321_E10]|uniref:hypothetical protein n=1 Tax=Holdemania sp. 1001302B_160321_E10 TaxID=2787120 RepID=UPI00189935BD|nr:hypothetical protein [Holdemania sp. 1001302B_160321_E10]